MSRETITASNARVMETYREERHAQEAYPEAGGPCREEGHRGLEGHRGEARPCPSSEAAPRCRGPAAPSAERRGRRLL